jgi:hypothetical protein
VGKKIITTIPLSADLLCKSPVRHCMVETLFKSITLGTLLRNTLPCSAKPRWFGAIGGTHAVRLRACVPIYQWVLQSAPPPFVAGWGNPLSHTCKHVLSGSAWLLSERPHKRGASIRLDQAHLFTQIRFALMSALASSMSFLMRAVRATFDGSRCGFDL